MKKVGAYEAKTHLPALLKEVAGGERISITRKGVPVAMLVPAARADKASVDETIRKIREFRKGVGPAGVPIREMIEEGRSR
jgi:prevent-host-death family protein